MAKDIWATGHFPNGKPFTGVVTLQTAERVTIRGRIRARRGYKVRYYTFERAFVSELGPLRTDEEIKDEQQRRTGTT